MTAKQGEERGTKYSSRMPFDSAEQEAQARKAPLFPGGKVTCQISQRAAYQILDFERRVGLCGLCGVKTWRVRVRRVRARRDR